MPETRVYRLEDENGTGIYSGIRCAGAAYSKADMCTHPVLNDLTLIKGFAFNDMRYAFNSIEQLLNWFDTVYKLEPDSIMLSVYSVDTEFVVTTERQVIFDRAKAVHIEELDYTKLGGRFNAN